MARRVYSDEDKARVYVVLETNGGNVKRTARDTGLPITTVRRWAMEWEESGPPSTELVTEQAADFVEHAERVRDKALAVLESKLDSATPSALVATIGMLQDKVSIARGLATSRTETVHSLPSADEMAATLQSALRLALQSAQSRDEEIVDAEIEEQALVALPSGREE